MYQNKNIEPFKKKIFLSSPTMHGDELFYMKEAYNTNWMSTVGENINKVEQLSAEICGMKHAVALCNCTSALHLCIRYVGQKLYGKPSTNVGTLVGKKVFCSDMTFAATLNPVAYEGGEAVFIDTDINTWNMNPEALERAFNLFPEVKIVIYAELYGFPGNVKEIRKICDKHNAILIEDAAEAMGAIVDGEPCGSFGDYSAISFNGNKIITGSSGGCFLTNDLDTANIIRKWSTQSREPAPWYQHEDVGFNYRMSNVVAGVVRGQFPHLKEHIEQKKTIYERYKEGLKGLPIKMNPIFEGTTPNYWLSALIIEKDYLCSESKGELSSTFIPEHGKSCPSEILQAIANVNAEGRPIWKPMHLQPMYKSNLFIGKNGIILNDNQTEDVGLDIFMRGCCLPSDNKMTEEEQNIIIQVIRNCFE